MWLHYFSRRAAFLIVLLIFCFLIFGLFNSSFLAFWFSVGLGVVFGVIYDISFFRKIDQLTVKWSQSRAAIYRAWTIHRLWSQSYQGWNGERFQRWFVQQERFYALKKKRTWLKK